MSDFKPFAAAVHAQYNAMAVNELFVTGVDPDEVYAGYLTAFPEGTNPVFRERTEHDCSCCRNFIKNIGPVVAIIDGQLVSVWDIDAAGLAPEYKVVTEYLSAYVKNFPVVSLFRSQEPSYGAENSKELRADGTVHTWNHFHGKVHAKHASSTPGAAIGAHTGAVQVFRRGLEELTAEALDTVIDLAESNNLYKGEEFLPAVRSFRAMHTGYQALSEAEKALFVHSAASTPAARIRNTAIGTLLQDLSEGVDLERAVKSFEDKVSGTNYKRPTALVTPGMIKQAMETIVAEGLEASMVRRHANLADITRNNVLWADGSAVKQMKGGLEALLMDAVAPKMLVIDASKAEEISIADFMANIVPQAHSIDLLVKNSQQGNFMSVTAPVHADAPPLFKWDNGFAWSYTGAVADAIKERVKAAGGSVEGDLCCRLAWEYTDDLDFHMIEPNGHEVYFGNRRTKSPNGGMLDVDANGMDGIRNDPVENIFYADRRKMKNGQYQLLVSNYNRRSNGSGFEVQIEFDGQLHHIVYTGVVPQGRSRVAVASIEHKDGVFKITQSLPATVGAARSNEKWGVKTETLVKVQTIMHSPNHWDGNATGNRHYFFILDGCHNPDPVRGIYNEFLRSDLEKHRKVFEILGDRTKCQPVSDQLSGVGFSTTKRDAVLVNVTGAKLRKSYNITF